MTKIARGACPRRSPPRSSRARSPARACAGRPAGPTKYASVSSANTASSTVKTASRPSIGISRSRTMCARPSPTQAAPRNGRADRDRRRPARPAEPLSRNASGERQQEAAEHPLGAAERRARRSRRAPPAKPASATGRSGRMSRKTSCSASTQRRPPRARRATSRRGRRGRAPAAAATERDEDARDAGRCTHLRRRTGAAGRVRLERLAQVLLAEVGPERVHEDELGVGELPEQEVRDPQLARRADEQVRVGHLRRVEVARRRPPRRGSSGVGAVRRAAA